MKSLDFDDLLGVERLRSAVATATGRGVYVAILDTGIDVTHPDLQGAVVRSVEVLTQPQLRVQDVPVAALQANQLDPVGHGTACAGIIHQLAPEARLISVRVIGAGAAGTGEQFVRGLQWVLTSCEPKPQVVNLSLGTMEERYATPLRKLVDQAYANDIVLVAAANNMGAISYPAQFASLISVDNQGFPDPLLFHYQRGRPIELVARGIYVRAPKSGGGHQLWTGTSFACPHITAVVARLLSLNPHLTAFQVKTLLHVLRANRTSETESKPPT
jgi:subtilisin family serine protease